MIFFEDQSMFVFFGKRGCHIEKLKNDFPLVNFKRIKQVHGDKLVHTSAHSVDFSKEADAHYTGERNLALAISTADCIPVMIYHENPKWISGIHAGWRGVLNKIVPKTIAALKKNGCLPEKMKIFIGPHICFESFEVENEIRDQLLATVSKPLPGATRPSREGKSLVSLIAILENQLLEAGVNQENIKCLLENTVTNKDYDSYRRDKENSGRQLSFICLK
jgi:YfiH family protein